MIAKIYKPVVLCILDGFGISDAQDQSYNAIKLATTPCLDFFNKNFPHTELITSGETVGLPAGQMGNSEVGHMTIGSGRIIQQDLLRINNAINNGQLTKHLVLQELIDNHKNNRKVVHLLGLCSDGGVHSHIDHLLFIASFLSSYNIQIKLHLFLDGRDVGPSTASVFLEKIDNLLEKYQSIKIATISGRFYAMDRDNRWERSEIAYKAIVEAKGQKIFKWQDYLAQQYQNNIYDEFIVPAILPSYDGFKEGDSIFFINFRSDRIRQLAQSILLSQFDQFPKKQIKFTHKIGMTHYSKELSEILTTLFPEQIVENNLAKVISMHNKKQLRIAETEKYAHVTFFFNSGVEEKYPGEERILIPSPHVRTYDLQPSMSADLVTEELVKAIKSQQYDLIIVNYANCDMVGHCGKVEASIKAVEVIDDCLAKVYQVIKQTNGILMITADHGNVEHMFDHQNNVAHTAHTTNPVPLILVANDLYGSKLSLTQGNLSDIAPTILKLINIAQPKEMTGISLII